MQPCKKKLKKVKKSTSQSTPRKVDLKVPTPGLTSTKPHSISVYKINNDISAPFRRADDPGLVAEALA
jgi:hypothetical protein